MTDLIRTLGGVSGASIIVMAILNGCSSLLGRNAPDEAAIEAHAATLAKCRGEGREAGTYAAYEGCKREAGIR